MVIVHARCSAWMRNWIFHQFLVSLNRSLELNQCRCSWKTGLRIKNKAGNRCGGPPALEAFSKTKKREGLFRKGLLKCFFPLNEKQNRWLKIQHTFQCIAMHDLFIRKTVRLPVRFSWLICLRVPGTFLKSQISSIFLLWIKKESAL